MSSLPGVGRPVPAASQAPSRMTEVVEDFDDDVPPPAPRLAGQARPQPGPAPGPTPVQAQQQPQGGLPPPQYAPQGAAPQYGQQQGFPPPNAQQGMPPQYMQQPGVQPSQNVQQQNAPPQYGQQPGAPPQYMQQPGLQPQYAQQQGMQAPPNMQQQGVPPQYAQQPGVRPQYPQQQPTQAPPNMQQQGVPPQYAGYQGLPPANAQQQYVAPQQYVQAQGGVPPGAAPQYAQQPQGMPPPGAPPQYAQQPQGPPAGGYGQPLPGGPGMPGQQGVPSGPPTQASGYSGQGPYAQAPGRQPQPGPAGALQPVPAGTLQPAYGQVPGPQPQQGGPVGALQPQQQEQFGLLADANRSGGPPQQQGERFGVLEDAKRTGAAQQQFGVLEDAKRAAAAPQQPPQQQFGILEDAKRAATAAPSPQQQFGLLEDAKRAEGAGGAPQGTLRAAAASQGGGPMLPMPPTVPTAAGPGVPARDFHAHAPPALQMPLHGQLSDPGVGPPGSGPPGQPLAPPMFTMEALPPDQRFVALNEIQANDIVQQLTAQSAYSGGPLPKIVDLSDAHKSFMDHLGAQRLAYMRTLELAAPGQRLPPNAKPSLLQSKLKSGQNRLEQLIQPVMEPGRQGFVDLSYTPDGALLPETSRVWQFGLSLVKATGVGPTGLRNERQPCMFVARMALFDRANNRFVGNVLGVKSDGVTGKDAVWSFNPKERVIVRCSCVQPDNRTGTRLISDEHLSLYIELNTSYRLSIEDTRSMPNSEAKAHQMVDEVTSAWSMVSFRKCTHIARETEVSVPLYYGSLYDPQQLDAMYKAERKKNPLSSFIKPKENPVLTFRAGPLPTNQPPLLPYGFMPTTMMAMEDLASAMAAYRLALALQLARQHSPFAPISEPVLTAFQGILKDHHLLTEFLIKWKDLTLKLCVSADAGCLSPQVLPPIAALIEAFRRCVIEVSPLLQCCNLPPRHINNFVEYQGHRLKVVQAFCHVINPSNNTIVGARHPVEPLSHAGFEYLHKPFDVSEIRLCMANRLEQGKTWLSS